MQTRHKPKQSDPKPMDDVLRQSTLQALYNKSQRLLRLQRLLSEVMPDEYAVHCQIMNLADACLVIGVDSAAWATRLRYQNQIVLERLRQYDDFRSLQSIEFKVQNIIHKEVVRPKVQRSLSESSREVISEMADNIQNDDLKAALLKLSGYHIDK